MAKLSEPVKLFIVQHLACFDTPKEIADLVGEEFGITVDRRHVEEYDPAKRSPGKKWRAIHAEARRAFLEEAAKEPAAERAYRVRRLARMARRAETKGNNPLAAALLKQIAEEMCGSYGNKRELTGANGAPLIPPSPHADLSPAELTNLASQLIQAAAADAS